MLNCFSVAVLSAQSVSQCVRCGEVSRQLEWVLLDARLAPLQRLIQQGEGQAETGTGRQPLLPKRHQASAAPCQELLDVQERI